MSRTCQPRFASPKTAADLAGGGNDRLGLFGIRRDFHPGAGVDHQLLVADATALPAAAAILESLPDGVSIGGPLGIAACLPKLVELVSSGLPA